MKSYTLEVLVSTMNQVDLSLSKKMNLNSQALIINQCDKYEYEEINYNGNKLRMISNKDRGLSKSRNQALLHAEGDICLIADDDIRYVNDYEKKVVEAFRKIPDADIIVFNTTMLNDSSGIKRKDIKNIRRAPKYKYYGSVRIAFRKNSFLKHNIWFNTIFGAGSLFGAGEETLVIRDANKKGLKIYEYPEVIAEVDYSASTWFEGYNEKYFYDKGAWIQCSFPRLKYIIAMYFIYRFKKLSEFSYIKIFKLIKYGMDGYRNMISYKEFYINKDI